MRHEEGRREEGKEWSVDGLLSIRHFLRRAKKQLISRKYLINQEKFYLLSKVRVEHMVSEGQRHVALKHNEQVGVNKRLLARVIHVVFFFW